MREQGTSAIDAVVAAGALSDAELARVVAEELHLPLVDLSLLQPMEGGAGIVDEATAQRFALVPVRRSEDHLVVAMANPLDNEALKRLEFSTGLGIRPVVTSRGQIFTAIQHLYGHSSPLASILAGAGSAAGIEVLADDAEGNNHPADVATIAREAEEAPIVQLVNLIVLQALHVRASDIHVEPARLLVEQSQHDALAMTGGNGRNADVDSAAGDAQ